MSAALLCLLLTTPASAGDGNSTSLATLVEAHEDSLGGIHEIELTLSFTGERFRPEHKGPVPLGLYRWAWKGNLERIRYVDRSQPPRDDGLTNNCCDFFLDGSSAKGLFNWDPEHPQKITPREQGTVKAQTWAYNAVPGQDPKVALQFAFDIPLAEFWRYSLAELIQDSNPPAVLKGKTQVSGRECWHIQASIPAAEGKSFGKTRFDIFIDPAVSFAVRLVEVEQRKTEKANGQPYTLYYRFAREVLEFEDCGNGVFVPIRTEQRHYNEGENDPYGVDHAVVSNLVVNKPLSPDAFDFKFPEYVQVVHLPAKQGKRRVELWGPDNKPVKEIRNPGDLPIISETTVAAGRWKWAIISLGVTALLIVVLWFIRRSRWISTKHRDSQ